MPDRVVIYLPDHGFSDGDHVTISGVAGFTDVNGTFVINDADMDSFKLSTISGGAEVKSDQVYISGGEAIDTKTQFDELDHLEGQDVATLGDGAVFALETVFGGGIELPQSVEKAVIGLPFRYNVQPMRVDMDTRDGTSLGSFKKIAEMVISFLDTLGARYGRSVDTLFPIEWRTTEDYGDPPELFTGEQTVVFDGGFSPDDPILISGDDPLPCTVRAIVPRMDKVGR